MVRVIGIDEKLHFGHVELPETDHTLPRGNLISIPAADLDHAVLGQLSAEGDLEDLWEEEWRKAVLGQCLGEIRGHVKPLTYRAFEEYALKQRPAAEVGRELGLTENAVFGARRRVLGRLREILPLMEDVW